MTVAKGITSGYMPLGAVVCGARVAEPFWAGDVGVFRHGYTYSGHAAACAVGLANLDLLVGEGLIDHVREIEPFFVREVTSLASHPLVKEVRSIGLLACIALEDAAIGDDPTLADRIVDFARERQLLLRSLLGHTLQVSPSFVIQEGQITTLVDRAREALDAAAA
jgi:adenosylmethionine-8-amino-7-oxononanoate aminotransferase